MSTTLPTSDRALALMTQAVRLLDNSDDDPRLSILMAASRAWDHTKPHDAWASILSDEGDPRWNAAAFLLKYDQPMRCERPLWYTAARLFVQITDQTEDLIGALSTGGRYVLGNVRGCDEIEPNALSIGRGDPKRATATSPEHRTGARHKKRGNAVKVRLVAEFLQEVCTSRDYAFLALREGEGPGSSRARFVQEAQRAASIPRHASDRPQLAGDERE
jgi:hypothetical protein